jgi:hypothetical protein
MASEKHAGGGLVEDALGEIVHRPPASAAVAQDPPSSGVAYYENDKSQAELGQVQQRQGQGEEIIRNDCAQYAAVMGINLLLGESLSGSEIKDLADKNSFPIPLWGLRMWPNGPTSPQQQVNLINLIAEQNGLPVKARAVQADDQLLLQALQDPDSVVSVTLLWAEPSIAHPLWGVRPGEIDSPVIAPDSVTDPKPILFMEGDPPITGHAMVLAAYDSEHRRGDGTIAPWGFINSWVDGSTKEGKEIYWMTDEDFKRTWGHGAPFFPSNSAVVITRDDEPDPSPVSTPPTPDAGTSAPSGTPSPQGH